MKKCLPSIVIRCCVRHEGEALAQLKQELLELVDQGLLEVGLKIALVLADSRELQNVGVLHQVRGPLHFVPVAG